MKQQVGCLEIEVPPTNAQIALLRDEAVAAFTARNHLREALMHSIGKALLEGKDASKLLAAVEKLCTMDPFTEQILKKMV